jgi:cell wall-associated NlpC family hydrolase
LDMRTVAFALVIQFSVGLLVDTPVAAAGRPSTAHVAISLGDGRTIESKKSGKPKALKANQQSLRKGIRKR